MQDTWDLQKLYSNNDQAQADILKAVKDSELFAHTYKGIDLTLDSLRGSLDDYFALSRLLQKPLTYSNHLLDEDTTNEQSIRLNDFVRGQVTTIISNISFYLPSLNHAKELLETAVKLKEFADVTRFIEGVLRKGAYTLNEQLEKMLADSNQLQMQPNLIYDALTTTDMTFDDISDENNQSHPMSHGLYGVYLQSEDRQLRKAAFLEMLTTFGKINNSLARVYIGQITSEIFVAQSRGYRSLRSSALFNNEIDEQVYDNLLEVVGSNLGVNHQYINVRKQQLGFNDLHLYDMYTPLVANVAKEYTFEQAKEMVLNALAPLGSMYVTLVEKCFQQAWIDIYERPGKQTGAYSGGCYDSYPYILLNYNGTLNDVYTLAHEIGHSIHTYLSNHAQEFQNSGYTIFVAEIASTLNELLLTDYLYENSQDQSTKAYILNYKLEQYRTTVIRQTMFAEFEQISKSAIENKQPLAASDLNTMYLQLNEKYFGNDVIIDDEIKYEWSRIPHFYYNYYVYQYATSFCYSVEIYRRIKENPSYNEQYLEFLKIGDSKSPMNSLKQIDIDAQSKVPFQSAIDDFAQTLDKFTQIIK